MTAERDPARQTGGRGMPAAAGRGDGAALSLVQETAVVCAPVWRWIAGALVALSRASLVAILGLVLWADDPPVSPPVLVELVVTFALLPAVAARAVARAFRARIAVTPDGLVIEGQRMRMEVLPTKVGAVTVWRLPVPGPGLSVRLAGERPLRLAVRSPDVAGLLRALAAAGARPAAAALGSAAGRFAAALQAQPATRWYHLLGRYVLFGALPAGVLFRAHQYIAYGGLFGQYRLLGPGPYLRTLGVYWLTVTLYLVLYRNLLWLVTEAAALAATGLRPAAAPAVRRAATLVREVLYYGGVPVLLALRFAPW